MKAKFVGIKFTRNGRFIEYDETGAKHMNMIGKTSSGTVIYVRRETRAMLILAVPGAKRINRNIYPLLCKIVSKKNINQNLIDQLCSVFYNVDFNVDKSGRILDLTEKIKWALGIK